MQARDTAQNTKLNTMPIILNSLENKQKSSFLKESLFTEKSQWNTWI